MSALGQKRSFGLDQPNVRYAPKADIPIFKILVRAAIAPDLSGEFADPSMNPGGPLSNN